jgi:hypothetical protein
MFYIIDNECVAKHGVNGEIHETGETGDVSEISGGVDVVGGFIDVNYR